MDLKFQVDFRWEFDVNGPEKSTHFKNVHLTCRRPGFKSCHFLLANGHEISSCFQMGIRFEISSRFQIVNGPEKSSHFKMGI